MDILIADDNENMSEVLQEFLEISGFNVVGCSTNGKDIIALYKQNPSSMILMDLNMPQYDGLYGIKHIQKINPNAKIIMLTGSPAEEILEKIKNDYNVEILRKPYPPERLIEKLNLSMNTD